MGRFFIEKKDINAGEIVVSGREARHMIEVLRLAPGDNMVMFDGQGGEYSGKIKDVDRKKTSLTAIISKMKEKSNENGTLITLAQAIPKKNKMDLIVEKATELGVHKIIPMITDRTIVRPEESLFNKMNGRWKRIAIEASKQCACAVTPSIDPITSFRDVIGAVKTYDLSMLACISHNTIPIKKAMPSPLPRNILVMIGPEGDFSEREVLQAEDKKINLISLGPRVLKSDTAGIFVVSVIGYEGGNIG